MTNDDYEKLKQLQHINSYLVSQCPEKAVEILTAENAKLKTDFENL